MPRFQRLGAERAQPEHYSQNDSYNSLPSTTYRSSGGSSLVFKVCRNKLAKTDLKCVTVSRSTTIKQLKYILVEQWNVSLPLDKVHMERYDEDTRLWRALDDSNLSVAMDQLGLSSGTILSLEYRSSHSTTSSGSRNNALWFKLCKEPRNRENYMLFSVDSFANFGTLRKKAYRELNKSAADRPIFLWIEDQWLKFDATTDNDIIVDHSLKEDTFVSTDFEEDMDTNFTGNLCGIANLGTTCFMNSVFQCLYNIPELTTRLLICKDEVNAPIISSYTNLIEKMRSGKWTSVNPKTLVERIEENLPKYVTDRQQDAHEFMNDFLQLIHAELTTKVSLITEIFYGQLQSSVKCLSCNQTEITDESISCLPLPISSYNQKTILYIKANGEQHLKYVHVDSSIRTIGDLINCFLVQHDLKLREDQIKVFELINNRAAMRYETWRYLLNVRDKVLAFFEYPEKSAHEKHIWCEFIDRLTGAVFRPPTILICPSDRCYYSDIDDQVGQLLGHLCSITGALFSDCRLYWSDGVRNNNVLKVDNDEVLSYITSVTIEMDPSWIDIYKLHTNINNSADNSALIGLLNDFFREEPLDTKYECSRCPKLTQARKKSSLSWPLPNVFIVQLKRFMYDQYSTDKIDTYISFPLYGLDLHQYITQDDHDKNKTNLSTKYDLVAVSNHSGSLTSGHYTTYAKHQGDGNWYSFDDKIVTRLNSDNDIVTKNAYILVYVKVT